MFNVPPTAKVIWRRDYSLSLIQQTGGATDQTQDPWVQGEWFIHFTTTAPGKLGYIHFENSVDQNLLVSNE